MDNNRIKNKTIPEKAINAFFLLISALGCIMSIRMDLVGRSLWYDEAALAWSFTKRDFFSLVSEPLEHVQAAPVGWLYIVKVFTLIFGNTDFTLRVPSIAAYVLTLLLIYLVLKDVVKTKYPLAGAAVAANMELMLQYSNVFKPYMSDCVITLFMVCLFFLYEEGRIKALTVTILFAVLIWFSNPACFVGGGLLASGFIYSLCEKEYNKLKQYIIIGVPMGLSFLADYLFWLKDTDERMHAFWEPYRFPLLPGPGNWAKLKEMTGFLTEPLSYLTIPVMILFFWGLVFTIKKKNRYVTAVYITVLLSLLASSLGFFPVNKRMWLFIYPLLIITALFSLDTIMFVSDNKRVGILSVVIMLALVLSENGIIHYFDRENVYWPGYEVKDGYNYLASVIQADEKVFVNGSQTPIFAYYNNYEDELKDMGNEVRLGRATPAGAFKKKDLSYIIDSKKCYIVMGNTWDDPSCEKLFTEAKKHGYIDMVYNEHETPLFYYCEKEADRKPESFDTWK